MVIKWIGVRPLRYRNDVFTVLNEIHSLGKTDIDTIRARLIDERFKREEKRLKVLRVSRTIQDRRRKREEFLTKAEQVMRVLRRTGLVSKDGDMNVLTKRGVEIVKLYRMGNKRADALFIESLLTSPYQTYWLFLKSLNGRSINIPRALWKRNRKLRHFISTQGFPLDVWSFFILRDLYYEFGLLNYVANYNQEKTFPLFVLNRLDTEMSEYMLHARTPEGRIHYWPSVSPNRFLQLLADTYLSITGGKWNRILDLIELRERFSLRHSMPEIEFNELYKTALSMRSAIVVVPSVGYIKPIGRTGYMTKVVNLPTGSDGLPLTHVRIER